MTDEKIDPDIWLHIQAATSIVGSLAAVAMAAQGYKHSRRMKPLIADSFKESLQEEIENSIKTVQKLLRFLSHSDLGATDVLGQRFEFGATPLYLDTTTFTEYQLLGLKLTTQMDSVNSLIGVGLRNYSEFMQSVGAEMIKSVENLPQRINGYYRNNTTNEAVVDDLLLILRAFEMVLDRVGRHN